MARKNSLSAKVRVFHRSAAGEKSLLPNLEPLYMNPDVVSLITLPDFYVKEHNPYPSGLLTITKNACYPALCGTRIGCGIAVVKLKGVRGISPEAIKKIRAELSHNEVRNDDPSRFLRNLPQSITIANWKKRSDALRDWTEFPSLIKELTEEQRRVARDDVGRPGLSGNHFIEIQKVQAVKSKQISEAFDLSKGDIVLTVHTESDALNTIVESSFRNEAGARLANGTHEQKKFLRKAKFLTIYGAFNRLRIAQRIVEAWQRSTNTTIPCSLLYDSLHESITMRQKSGKIRWEHRAGCAFACSPGDKSLPREFRKIGQPLFLPSHVGGNTLVLRSLRGVQHTEHTVNHGCPRRLSKTQARKLFATQNVFDFLRKKKITLIQLHNKELASQYGKGYVSLRHISQLMQRKYLAQPVAILMPVVIIKA